MKMISLACMFLITSCGGGGSSAPAPNNPPPVVVTAPPLKENLYIIGGQSNAEFLLYHVNGAPTDVYNHGYLNQVNKTVGYAYEGTEMDFWLKPQNSKPLFDIVSANCGPKTIFIWWQGEGDTTPDFAPFYKEKATRFFGQVKALCPTIRILEVIMEGDPNINYGYFGYIQAVQATLGDMQISAQNYELENEYHLTRKGYLDFWSVVLKTYPLS